MPTPGEAVCKSTFKTELLLIGYSENDAFVNVSL